MADPVIELVFGAELPDSRIGWLDRNGDAVDTSSGYTFTLKLATRNAPTTAVLTKTTGITGGNGYVDVAWSITAELTSLSVGEYTGQIFARRTSDTKDRVLPFLLFLRSAIA